MIANVDEPVAFVAVIVYDADAADAVGVPLSTPVEAFKVSPAGNAGETVQFVDAPPEFVGVNDVIAEFTVAEIDDVEYEILGAANDAVTSMLIVVVPDPAVLVAVTVYAADTLVAVGVPEI